MAFIETSVCKTAIGCGVDGDFGYASAMAGATVSVLTIGGSINGGPSIGDFCAGNLAAIWISSAFEGARTAICFGAGAIVGDSSVT
jgi:hypothetical protein